MYLEQKRPVGAYPWYTAGVLGCCYAVAFIDRGILGVAAAPVQQSLGLTDSQFGMLHGMAFVTLFFLAGIPLGWLADRWSRRAIIASGMLFWTAMTAACGLASGFAALFLARIGVGLGEACLVPAGASLLAALVPRQRLARATAIFLVGAAVGSGLALLGGGYLLGQLTKVGIIHVPLLGDLVPWRVLFLLACLPGLAAAPLVMTMSEPRRLHAPQPFWPHMRQTMAHMRRHGRAYGCLVGATACSNVLAQSQGAWMPLFYLRHFGWPPGQSAMLVGGMFLLTAPTGQFVGGYLADRLQARNVPGAQNLCLAMGLALSIAPGALFCSTSSLPLSIAGYMLFNFIAFATTPNGMVGTQIITPPALRGTATALMVAVVSLVGIGVGPAAVGLLTDHLFHDGAKLGWSMLLVFALAGLAGTVLALAGRRAFARAATP